MVHFLAISVRLFVKIFYSVFDIELFNHTLQALCLEFFLVSFVFPPMGSFSSSGCSPFIIMEK